MAVRGLHELDVDVVPLLKRWRSHLLTTSKDTALPTHVRKTRDDNALLLKRTIAEIEELRKAAPL